LEGGWEKRGRDGGVYLDSGNEKVLLLIDSEVEGMVDGGEGLIDVDELGKNRSMRVGDQAWMDMEP